jgi:hypothetical protein
MAERISRFTNFHKKVCSQWQFNDGINKVKTIMHFDGGMAEW